MIKGTLAHRAEELLARREPFVYATVVRAVRPTSVRAGRRRARAGRRDDRGLRRRRLRRAVGPPARAARAGDPRGAAAAHRARRRRGARDRGRGHGRQPVPVGRRAGDLPRAAGARAARRRSSARRRSPRALARLAPELDLEVGDAVAEGDLAVVVASHGRDELEALRAALAAHVPYVGLVASPRRGAAVVEELGAPPGAIETPAGLDIGARTPEEIALSILARVVAVRRSVAHAPLPAAAIGDRPGLRHGGRDHAPTRRTSATCTSAATSAATRMPPRISGLLLAAGGSSWWSNILN